MSVVRPVAIELLALRVAVVRVRHRIPLLGGLCTCWLRLSIALQRCVGL